MWLNRLLGKKIAFSLIIKERLINGELELKKNGKSQMNALYSSMERKNIVFYRTSFVLLAVLVLYPLFGGFMMSFVLPDASVEGTVPWLDRKVLSEIRAVQAIGQIVLICLPALFLTGFITGEKRLLSKQNLAFLGIGRRGSMQGVLLAITGVLLLQPFVYALMEATGYLLPYLGDFGRDLLENQKQLEHYLIFLAGADSASEFLVVLLVIAVIPAICEEIFFRGYIQKNYEEALTPFGGIALSGFVFGLFHLSPANLVPLTVMGWYLGYVYYKTRNLLVPVLVHFCNNFLALGVLQLQRGGQEGAGVIESRDVIGSALFPVLLISLPLFVLVLRSFNRRLCRT